jgi:hypothetical protein
VTVVKKPQVKFFLEAGTKVDLDAIVPVFHRFIRDSALGSELVIDVADYAHVPEGPGVVLIGDASDYYLDSGEGRPGLLYSRKRRASDDAVEAIGDALRRALAASRLLEAEALGFRFRSEELSFRVNDRLNAPNTKEAFESVRPALETALKKLYGSTAFQLDQRGDQRELLTIAVTAAGAPGISALLERLGGPPG